MIRQEAPRNFEEIFGKQTEDPVQLKDNELRESILTAANMLGNNPSESTLVGAIRAFSQQPKTFISKAGGLVYPVIHAGGERAEQLKVIGAILERLDPEYDVETGNIRMGYEPQKHAEDIYDHLSVGRVEEEWKEVQEEISEEDDINLRAQIALKAKQKLMRYFKHNPIKFFDDSRELKPTWKNISRNGTEATIELRHSTLRIESMGDIIEEVNRAIFRGQIEDSLDLLPQFDKEKFDELRNKFGAKAANLILLHETLPQINSLLRKSVPAYGQISIPDFVPVPAQLYKKWKSGENIDEDLEPYYDWASSLAINGQGVYVDEPDSYIVRSSAVNSEDGENLSGAGIYESVKVNSGDSGSFDKFKAAVVSVFESTDSPKGRTYREQNGIENEEMGLIIQRHKPDKYTYRDVKNSTVNSSASGQKELIEIKEGDSRFLIKKRVVDQTLMGELPNDAFLLKYDSKHRRGSLSNSKLRIYAALSIVMERMWGGRIQAEFIGDDIVQIRRLSESLPEMTVEFPEEKEIARGHGLGVGDQTLVVLDDSDDNSEREGIVQFETNYGWSDLGNNRNMPNSGAVMIRGQGGSNHHLQTLCDERGLVCMYPLDKTELPLLKYGASVRIVSNGIEARMYRVPGEEDPIKEHEIFKYQDDNDI